MEYKENNSNKIIKNLARTSNKIIKFNGDLVGLISLKLGNENIAYKALTKSRKLGKDVESTLEVVLEEKYENLKEKTIKTKDKISESSLDIDLDSIKEKGKALVEDVKNIRGQDIRDFLIKTETRIYGDTKKFYMEKEVVEEEDGFILEDSRWEKLD